MYMIFLMASAFYEPQVARKNLPFSPTSFQTRSNDYAVHICLHSSHSERPSLVDNPIYESADRYQNLHTRLHPHTLNTAQQSSIYSVVADRDERSDEECRKSVRESAENVSVDGEEKYMNQIATDNGCADNNKY
jgi:hypothetical protein